MTRTLKKRLSAAIWVCILLFIGIIISFPHWIEFFYPQPHKDIVFSAAYENNIDPYLAFAIIRTESKYQVMAESSAGAKGLMQLMPDTARWIADQKNISDFDLKQLHDPEINISFGCWYLANLNREFDGRIPIVIAAYNAGQGNVREWILQEKWDGEVQTIDSIPFAETRSYVKNVLKSYQAYQAIYK
ncbi:MAG: lytic transglycosylase domain-containing protein [Syntrophomonadaceae bacterium]|nr:lytic transglycosylase domain-containing protein [Syntrophomonadaceae bacterium]